MGRFGVKLLSKESILEKIGEYDIFKYYIPSFLDLNKYFCSELRRDRKPSCNVVVYNGRLLYKDFGDGTSEDCFSYIQKKFNVSFLEALAMVNRDFNLNLSTSIKLPNQLYTNTPIIYNKVHKEPSPAIIKVGIRKWDIHDKVFWGDRYKITRKILTKFNVYPLSTIFIDKENAYAITCGHNTYGYYFGPQVNGALGWKIYQPYDKKVKWISNCDIDTLQGYNQLPESGDKLIITKSLKDVLVLYKLGFNAIAPHGETYGINEDVMEELKIRFKDIIILYDNDIAGEKAAEKLAETHNLNYYFLPKELGKDCSDVVEEYDYEKLDYLIQKIWEKNIK